MNAHEFAEIIHQAKYTYYDENDYVLYVWLGSDTMIHAFSTMTTDTFEEIEGFSSSNDLNTGNIDFIIRTHIRNHYEELAEENEWNSGSMYDIVREHKG